MQPFAPAMQKESRHTLLIQAKAEEVSDESFSIFFILNDKDSKCWLSGNEAQSAWRMAQTPGHKM
jgi:hypothetical protein